MDRSERWQKLKEILYGALEMDPSERGPFLDEKCGGDAALRDEIYSLIEAHASGGRLESPAVEVLAALVSDARAEELIGKSLAHYEVV